MIGPAWRHPRGLAVVAFALVLSAPTFVGGSLLAYQVGLEERSPGAYRDHV